MQFEKLGAARHASPALDESATGNNSTCPSEVGRERCPIILPGINNGGAVGQGAARSNRRWGYGALLVVALVIAARFLPVRAAIQGLLPAIQRLGVWGPLLFVLLYIVACVLGIPGSLLTVGAGFIFGIGRGLVCVSAGSTLGATAAFLISRHLAREWVARRIKGHPRFAALDEAVGRAGWKIVLLTRLSPLFPFNLLNYAFGLTGVSLRAYCLASWVGMLPGAALYVYLGSLVGNLAGLQGGGRAPPALEWIFGGVTLLATLYLARVAGRALTRRVSEDPL
ncbi:MAG: TVP38/TMEM64 family protein [Verrucomicrobia bacterium]|nr:TVP38/TMEM64 family protein [Verrucomicrobiota bacterium]